MALESAAGPAPLEDTVGEIRVDPVPPGGSGESVGAVSARRRPLWILAGIVVGLLLFTLLAGKFDEFAGDEVGLGHNTVKFVEDFDGRRVSGHFREVPLLRQSFTELREEGRPVALWLGASQLFAINHPEDGDHLAIWHASKRAQGRGSDLGYLVAASGNGNLNELLAVYLAFRQSGLVPDLLILAFTYDDLGDPDIRTETGQLLRSFDEQELDLGGPGVQNLLAASVGAEASDGEAAPIERSATAGTPQELLEEALVRRIENAWPAYRSRGALMAAAITAWRMPLTTAAFKLFSRPQQAIPEELQEWNTAGLDAMLRFADADGVEVFIYKVPHRPGEEPFFHPRDEYDAYHAELEARCEREDRPYTDLETLVPADLWGITNNWQPDVFHFRNRGHELLGEAVDGWMEEHGY